MSTSIRISKNNHRKLVELAGILQTKLKRNISIDETIEFLLKKQPLFGKVSDLLGKWEISDEELDDIYIELRNGWKNWSLKE